MYALLREEDLELFQEEVPLEFTEWSHNIHHEPLIEEGKPRVFVVHFGTADGSEAAAIPLFSKHKKPLLISVMPDPKWDADMSCLAFTLNGVDNWHPTTPHNDDGAGNLVVQCSPLTGEPIGEGLKMLEPFIKGLQILLFEEFGLKNRRSFPF